MGDNQAVELGQLAHIQLGFLARAFSPLELLVVHGRAPRSAVSAGIVIDDVVFSEKSMPKVETGELESVKRLNLLCEEYLQQGLLAHPKKIFRGEAVGEFWGCYADLWQSQGKPQAAGAFDRAIPQDGSSGPCFCGAAGDFSWRLDRYFAI